MHLNFAADKKTDTESLLRDNIVIFEIYYKTFAEHVLAEEPKMNMIALISDLCATWSLYAGFSILSICTFIFTGCFVVAHFLNASTEFSLGLIEKQELFMNLKIKQRITKRLIKVV